MEWFIALRYLQGKRRLGFISHITYISIGGVFLGSIVIIVALSIANGFEKEVRDRIVGTFAHAKIVQYNGAPLEDYESIRQHILKDPDVIGASPYLLDKVLIEHEDIREGGMVFGIDPFLESKVTSIESTIKYGAFILDSLFSIRGNKLPGVVVGSGLADKIGLKPGSEIVLITAIPGETEVVTRMIRCVVSGIFETGLYEFDLVLTYIHLRTAQNLLQRTGVEGIQIKTTDLFKAPQIVTRIKDSLGGYPFKTQDWLSQNKSLFQWMKLEKLVIFIVISLIFIIAAFNIVSSMIMIILEKRKEIGILMAMGCTSSTIMKIFMLYGSIIGLVGSTTGTILATILCYLQWRFQLIPIPGDIYFINKVPVLLQFWDVVGVYISANVICTVATGYPALQASKIIPAESIRCE